MPWMCVRLYKGPIYKKPCLAQESERYRRSQRTQHAICIAPATTACQQAPGKRVSLICLHFLLKTNEKKGNSQSLFREGWVLPTAHKKRTFCSLFYKIFRLALSLVPIFSVYKQRWWKRAWTRTALIFREREANLTWLFPQAFAPSMHFLIGQSEARTLHSMWVCVGVWEELI